MKLRETNEFRARFKVKLENGKVDIEHEDIIVKTSELKEKETKEGVKLENVFGYDGGDYVFNSSAVRSFDKEGRPIVEYYLGNSLPIEDPSITPKNDKGKIVNAALFRDIFRRGKMISTLKSSQKEPEKFDRTALILGGLVGVFAGVMIALMLVLGDPHMFFPYGLPAKALITNVIG